MPKLVAIGDSLTQGVKSGAILDTKLSYPALIAEAMGLEVGKDFLVPKFPNPGLPLNIEWLLDSMKRQLGDSINWFEWRFELPFLLANRLDLVEDIYERGKGSRRDGYSGVYHNLAVSGFRVYDSFKVYDKYCSCQIKRKERWIEDDFLGLPSAPMYRIAQRVLNPGDIRKRRKWTQIDNLRHLNKNEGGVENLILFLGANDCLSTVKDLRIKEIENYVPSDPQNRRDYNLTNVEVFKSDYRKMVRKISKAILPNTKVFVGTIPHVTIPPVTRGLKGKLSDDDRYFQYYSYFFMNDDDFDPRKDRHLTGEQAQYIDDRIDEFNKAIEEIVETQNDDSKQNGEWHIVDICDLLDRLAVKRRGHSDKPELPLEELLEEVPTHPLLKLNPKPSVLFFESSDSNREAGGLFSLDCFHPTTIGYGLIAETFLNKMAEVGVNIATPIGDEDNGGQDNEQLPDWNRLNWNRLIAKDLLIQSPPALWDDVFKAAEAHPRFTGLIYRIMS